MKYKLIIFDLDGTILDTLEDLRDSVNYALDRFNMPNRSLEEIRTFVGHGIHNLIERSVIDNCDKKVLEDVFNTFKEYYSNHSMVKTKPYNGVLDTLKILKSKGLIITVASNKAETAVRMLCDKYFNNLIDYSIGDSINHKRKPDTDMIDTIISKYNINKDEVLYIGDSEVDYDTANKASIDLVMVSYGFRSKEYLKEYGATTIIDRLLDIIDIVGIDK